MYNVVFLPVAKQDLVEIISYVSEKLGNPGSAERLAVSLIEAAEALAAFPYANPVYFPIRPLGHEYRKLLVGNYLLLYCVDEAEKTVTIYRAVYARRSYEKLLP